MVSDSESSDSDVPISSTGVRRGQVAPESSDSDSKVPVSSTGVKRGRAAPDSGAPSGKRRKKISRIPYDLETGWSNPGKKRFWWKVLAQTLECSPAPPAPPPSRQVGVWHP